MGDAYSSNNEGLFNRPQGDDMISIGSEEIHFNTDGCGRSDPDLRDFDMGILTKLYIYFFSSFGCLSLFSLLGCESVKNIKRKVDKAQRILDKDFNIRHWMNAMNSNFIHAKMNK